MFDNAPSRLIDEQGRPAFGVYGQPISNVNLKNFDYRKVVAGPRAIHSRLARTALKRWQYVGIITDSLVLGAAVVDISFIANTFAYAYDRANKTMKEFEFMDYARTRTNVSPSSIQGVSEYRGKNAQVRMEYDPASSRRRVLIDIPGGLFADFELMEEGFTPLCAVTQNGLRGFNYCHKAAGLPVVGKIMFQGKTYQLDEGAMAVLDWSAGCPARHSFWNWASAGGKLGGKRIGLNFASGINERGFTENVFWADGAPVKVDTVFFDYDAKNILAPWRIRSNDGKADLTFYPESERFKNINFGLLASRFHQPFGRFEGTLQVGGKDRKVALYGFVEEHEATW